MSTPYRAIEVSPKTSLDEVGHYLDATVNAGKKITAEEFTTYMRTRSAVAHAATGVPLRRMLYPGALARKGTEADGRNAVLVYTGRRGLMVSAPGLAEEKASGDGLRALYGSAQYIIVALDRAAAASLEAVCNRSESSLNLAASIEVQRGMEVSSRLMILDTALARTFWAPPSEDDDAPLTTAAWCSLFGVGNDPDGWRALVGACMYDSTKDLSERRYAGFVASILDCEESMSTSLGKQTSVSGARLFSIQSSIGEAWAAIERIDPLLRPLFIASGEVVELTGAKFNGKGEMEAQVSVPCRVRAGDVIVCREDGTTVETVLGGMDYHGHLVGVFVAKSSGSRRNGGSRPLPGAPVQVLHDIVDATGRTYVTTAPFLGSSRANSVSRWVRTGDLPVLTPLQIPVDVAIAGAPDA